MSLFTKVPGIYRTRDGKHVWVKGIYYGSDDIEYPVFGCKAKFHENGEVTYITNDVITYTKDGRLDANKEQGGDIVAWAGGSRQVLIFRPVSDPPQHTRPTLLRWLSADGKPQYFLARYTFGAEKPMWFDINDSDIEPLDMAPVAARGAEWAELS